MKDEHLHMSLIGGSPHPCLLIPLRSLPPRCRSLFCAILAAECAGGIVPALTVGFRAHLVYECGALRQFGDGGLWEALAAQALQRVGLVPPQRHVGDPGHGFSFHPRRGCCLGSCHLHRLLGLHVFVGVAGSGLWIVQTHHAEVQETFPLLRVPPEECRRQLRSAAED